MEVVAWLVTAVGAFVLYAFVYRWVLHRNFKGPKLWPILGCTLEVAVNRWRIHDWVTDNCKLYSRTWLMRLPNQDFVVSVDPANVEHVLKTNFSNYEKGEMQHSLLFDVLGDGIFNADGELWRRHRKVASYEFASNVLRDYSSQNFKVHALSLCQILDRAAKENKAVDVMDLMLRLSFESICKMGFGMDMGLLGPNLPRVPFEKSFDAVTKRAADRYVDPLWKLKRFFGIGPEAAMKRHVKDIDTFTHKLILTRKAELKTTKQARPDLLSRFMETVEKEPLTSNSFKDLQDVVTNFVIAGRDTTAASLAWSLYAISCHPRVEEKIVEELLRMEVEKRAKEGDEMGVGETEGAFASFVRLLDHHSVNDMHYLQAAISEAMRLYSPIPSDIRVAVKDDILPCGSKIRAGDFFMYSAYSQGRMEQVWGDDCLEYKPERWLRAGIYQQESQFKYPVFHGGPRVCLGKESALLQLKITLATLLRFFTFRVVPGHRVTYKVTITLQASDDGMQMVVQRRS